MIEQTVFILNITVHRLVCMKKYIFILFLVSAAKMSYAQTSEPSYRYVVKLYNLITYEPPTKQYTNPYQYSNTKKIEYLHPTFAVELINKNGKSHEFELTEYLGNSQTTSNFLDSVPYSDSETRYKNRFTLRYEYAFVSTSSEKKISLSLGAGAGIYYYKDRYIGSFIFTPSTYAMPDKEVNMGMRAYFVPRLHWAMGKRFNLDLNIPVCFAQLNNYIVRVPNPALKASEQTNSTIDFNVLPKLLSVRLGVGLRI